MKEFSFIHGQLIENSVGASYEGYIWNRWLKVRISDEIDIEVFDENNISESLVIGNYYDFIISPLLGDLNLPINSDRLQSVELICENWLCKDAKHIICASESLIGRLWLILLTIFGCVLISQNSLQYANHLTENKYEVVIARWDLEGVSNKIVNSC
jgi:hypothetical protein